MFRPCKWAIIRLLTELLRMLYTRCGEYLGDEISSYITVRWVSTGYHIFTYVCMYLPSEMHAKSLSNLGMQVAISYHNIG
jgi:hypothetical protein